MTAMAKIGRGDAELFGALSRYELSVLTSSSLHLSSWLTPRVRPRGVDAAYSGRSQTARAARQPFDATGSAQLGTGFAHAPRTKLGGPRASDFVGLSGVAHE